MKVEIHIKTEFDSEKIVRLVNCCIECHQNAAFKNLNASSAAFQNAHLSSGDLEKGIASAILTLGNNHGPISAARDVFQKCTEEDIAMVDYGYKIAGFGNSFFKDRIDPSFQPLDDLLRDEFKESKMRIDELTAWMQKRKKIYPNAALYTAVVCEIAGIDEGKESMLFILARLPVWVNL